MLSVVVPVFNEEESLSSFYRELLSQLRILTANYEVIFIDDGSTDSSLGILKKLADKNKKLRIFSFRRNQGKAEALTLGFQRAKGDYIATLDADLQDKPSEIKKLLKKSKEGWDLVSGWRKDRKDSPLKVLSSRFFNFLAYFLWGLEVNDLNCGLKVYTKDAAKSLNLYGGMHRFIPLLLDQDGFRVTEVPIVHEKRKYGHSKYGFTKIFTELPDLFTMLFLSRYSKKPLHFFGTVGLASLTIGFIILIYLTILRFRGETIGDRPLLLFGILLVLTGFQVFFTGFLADLFLHLSKKNTNGINIKYETR